MKNVALLVRIVLFAAGLAAIAYLSLQLKAKWDREAKDAAAAAAPADAGK